MRIRLHTISHKESLKHPNTHTTWLLDPDLLALEVFDALLDYRTPRSRTTIYSIAFTKQTIVLLRVSKGFTLQNQMNHIEKMAFDFQGLY